MKSHLVVTERPYRIKFAGVLACARAGSMLIPVSANAKDWFDSCTITQKDGKNAFVGGEGKMAHLHVGPDFIDDTRNPTGLGGRYTTDFPKKQLENKCKSLTMWKNAIKTSDKSQYQKPADVSACLTTFMQYIGCP